MGRITIFVSSGDTCPYSQRLYTALQARDIPYTVIDIAAHPDKRKDMMALSCRLSTPQVFFNTRHVGGCEETVELLTQWERDIAKQAKKSKSKSSSSKQRRGVYKSAKERFENEIQKFPDPLDSRFHVPTTEPIRPEPSPLRDANAEYCILLPSSSSSDDESGVGLPKKTTVVQMQQTLLKILPLSNRVYNLTTYKNVFTGQEFVKNVSCHYGISNDEAIAFGRYLQTCHILDHVHSEHDFDSNGSDLYYRLTCHATPDILNSYRIWTEAADASHPIRLVSKLIHMLRAMLPANTDPITGKLNAAGVAADPAFASFEEAVCELQKVDFKLMSDDTKKAFGINVFNLMVRYGYLKFGVPQTEATRNAFFQTLKIHVGGYTFSLWEFQNGFLLANNNHGNGGKRIFGRRDPRSQICVKLYDVRLRFAASGCTTSSCPSANFLTDVDLNEELRIMAQAFCEDDKHVYVDSKKHTLHLSPFFRWYAQDFVGQDGSSLKHLPSVIARYFPSTKKQALDRLLEQQQQHALTIKIAWIPYEWSIPNVINYKKFDDPTVLIPNERTVKSLLLRNRNPAASSSDNNSPAPCNCAIRRMLSHASTAYSQSKEHRKHRDSNGGDTSDHSTSGITWRRSSTGESSMNSDSSTSNLDPIALQ